MRVLVVDDSAVHRLSLSSALKQIPSVTSVETARSGPEAIRLIHASAYDLVTLDIEMPEMDGFAVLRWIMATRPLPVLVVSDALHDRVAIVALELGAFDVLRKPTARAGGQVEWREQLARAVAGASGLHLRELERRARSGAPAERPAPPGPLRPGARGESPARAAAIVVAASTGGPAALRDLFASLPPRGSVVAAVAQHMSAPFTKSLAARLGTTTGWRAVEASDGEEAVPGTILVAPGGHDMELVREGSRVVCRVRGVPPGEERRGWSPSGDRLLASAARVYGAGTVAVVLTGMGSDGAEGAAAVDAAGGLVVAESSETAVVAGMPEAAARRVPAALRLPLHEIGRRLERRIPLATLPGSV